MTLVILKIIVLMSLMLIFIQDIKHRQVWALLLPVYAVTGGWLFLNSVITDVFLSSIFINLSLVTILFFINFLIAKFILKKSLFKEAIGLGDVLFIIGLAVSFPTISFVNFLVFSLLFSLSVHLLLKLFSARGNSNNSMLKNSVPLAGYMSIFLIGIYVCNWMGYIDSIYLM